MKDQILNVDVSGAPAQIAESSLIPKADMYLNVQIQVI